MRASVLIFLVIVGCADKPPPDTTGPADALEVNTEGRVVVAQVNGTPVLADCVETQAREEGISVELALDRCIDFELLAASATAYRNDPAVIESGKQARVLAFLREQFEPAADSPEDIPVEWLKERAWSKEALRKRFNHPEYRHVDHAVILLSKDLADDHPDVVAARKLATEWYREWKKNPTEDRAAVQEMFKRIAGDRPYRLEKGFLLGRTGNAVEEFSAMAFSLPKAGVLSEPVRTEFGYHVIFLYYIDPETRLTLEGAAPILRKNLFSLWRNKKFVDWLDALSATHDIKIREELLDAVEIATSSVMAPTP